MCPRPERDQKREITLVEQMIMIEYLKGETRFSSRYYLQKNAKKIHHQSKLIQTEL